MFQWLAGAVRQTRLSSNQCQENGSHQDQMYSFVLLLRMQWIWTNLEDNLIMLVLREVSCLSTRACASAQQGNWSIYFPNSRGGQLLAGLGSGTNIVLLLQALSRPCPAGVDEIGAKHRAHHCCLSSAELARHLDSMGRSCSSMPLCCNAVLLTLYAFIVCTGTACCCSVSSNSSRMHARDKQKFILLPVHQYE